MKDLLDRVRKLRYVPDKGGIEHQMSNPLLSIPMLEALLKRRKEEEHKILTGSLLEWMQENDQILFESDEEKVTISTYVSAKIFEDEAGVKNVEAAFKWLEDQQYGDMIKDTLEFPKGELTPEIMDLLNEQGLSYTKKQGIHPQTLKKVMSDRLKDEEDLPTEEDGFLINYYDECKVKAK